MENQKQKSPHTQFVQFWYDTVKSARGITYIKGIADMRNLKRVLDTGVIDEPTLEKLALFFLADYGFKKMSPTIAVFLSGGVLTGLQNTMRNNPDFWKTLDGYGQRYLKSTITSEDRKNLMHSLAALRAKFGVV